MKKKLYFLFLFLVLMAFLVIWRKPLSSHLTCLAFKYFSEKSLGEPLNFESLRVEKGRVILTSPKLGNLQKALTQGGLYLEGETAIFEYDLDWMHKRLELHLDLERPKLQIVKTRAAYLAIQKLLTPSIDWIEIKTTCRMSRGSLSLIDENEKIEVDFNFETKEIGPFQTISHLCFLQETSYLKGFFHKQKDSFDCKIDLENVQLNTFLSIANYFLDLFGKKTFPELEVEGLLQGSCDLLAFAGSSPRAQIKLDAHQLKMNDPKRHLKVILPNLSFSLDTNHRLKDQEILKDQSLFKKILQNSFSSFSLPGEGEVIYQPNHQPVWKFEHLKGKSVFSNHSPVKTHFEGELIADELRSKMQIEGLGFFSSPRGELKISMQNNSTDRAHIHGSLDPLSEGRSKLSLELQSLTEIEVALLQKCLGSFYPHLKKLHFKEGMIDAQLRCFFEAFKPSQCFVDHFDFKNISFMPSHYLVNFQNLYANGSGHLDFNQKNPLKHLSGDMDFKIKSLHFNQHFAENVEGHCLLQKGHVEACKIQTSFSGIEGLLEWKPLGNQKPLSIQLKGVGQNFFRYLPTKFTDLYQKTLALDAFLFQIEGNVQEKGIELDVLWTVQNKDNIHFTLNFLKDFSVKKEDKKHLEFYDQFIKPLRVVPTLGVFERFSLGRESFPFKLEKGSLSAFQIPVEKYASPLIFGNTSILFTGRGDVKGTFNPDTLALEYSNYDFNLEHADVALQFKESGPHVGHHYFNLKNGTHFGEVNLTQGSCSLKGCGLNFQKLNGTAYITSNCISIPKLISLSEKMTLDGNVKIYFLDDGGLRLRVDQPNLEGNFSSFKSFFKVFGDSLLDTLPIEGKMHLLPQTGFFELRREQETYTHELRIGGAFTQGEILLNQPHPLKDLSAHFFYDSIQNIFELKKIQGKYFVNERTFFDLKSPYLKLDFNDSEASSFDVRLKNRTQDLVRLKGKLFLNPNSSPLSLKIILDSKDNHVGTLRFNHANLNMMQGLEYLHLDFTSQTRFLNQDIQLLRQLIDHPSLQLFTHLKDIPLQGEVCGQWIFNRLEEKHQFFAWGDQMRVGKSGPSPLQIKGHIQKGLTYLDEFSFNQFKVSLKLEEKPFSYFIHDLRIQNQQNLHLDLSGIYCKIFNTFQAHIHKFHINLNEFNHPVLEPFETSGKLDFKGVVDGGIFKKGWKVFCDLKGKTNNFKAQGLLFADDLLSFKAEWGPKTFKIESIIGEIQELFSYPLHLKFRAHHLNLCNPLFSCSVEKVDFKLPAESLHSIQKLSKNRYQKTLPHELSELKKTGWIQGSLAYHPDKKPYALSLKLKDDQYSFKEKEYALQDVILGYGAQGLSLGVKIHYHQWPYWIYLSREASIQNLITCTLYDQNPVHQKTSSKMILKCLFKNQKYPIVQSIQGEIGGIKVNFVHRPENEDERMQVLTGQIQIQKSDFLKKIPQNYTQFLNKVGLGKGYFLSGQLMLKADDLKKFSFKGLLGGQNFDLMGYSFKSLSSIISFSSSHVSIRDLKISDLSGEFFIPELEILDILNRTHFNIPKVILKDFKPSLLHKKGEGFKKHSPLMIQSLEFKNLRGNFQDPGSIVGSGTLKFLKTHKKQTSLLDIPVQFLNKLGLDLTMLNPVEGKILYEVKDQKVHFTRFVDVYSPNRNCYFQLAKSPGGSYMDFQGNLNMHIKMKQFVLLKITQPFIISIQGNALNPKYSFKRKKVKVDVPEKLSL